MKEQIKKSLLTLCLFIFMAGITVGSGYYKKSVSSERGSFIIALPAKKDNQEVLLNIAEQGLPKKLIQPNRISISSGHGGGIINRGNESLWVKVQTEGFLGKVQLESKDPSFNHETGVFSRPLKPNQSFNLAVNLTIPKGKLKGHTVTEGNIKLINSKDESLIGNIPVRIINSETDGIEDSTKNNDTNEACH
jgi:hypothetical protein